MSFDLKQPEQTGDNTNKFPQYQKPGIYDNVVITEVVFGKSSFKQTPFIQLKTKGQNGEVGKSANMYLTTTKSEGKSTAAWNITSRNILDLVIATHNISREEAETIELVPSNTQSSEEEQMSTLLPQKVASLLVGKPFRAKFKGEQGNTGTIFSTLDKVESMNVPKAATSLKFNELSDIRMYPTVNNSDSPVINDMPF